MNASGNVQDLEKVGGKKFLEIEELNGIAVKTNVNYLGVTMD